MLVICCNISFRSWRNRKTFWETTKIKTFINKYKWDGINFLSEKNDWKKTEKNSVTIALNVLYVKNEKIYLAYVSKNNSNREKKNILLIISNGEKWHYLAVKKNFRIIKRNNIKK